MGTVYDHLIELHKTSLATQHYLQLRMLFPKICCKRSDLNKEIHLFSGLQPYAS